MEPERLFTWVHLSDVHFGFGDAGTEQHQRLVLGTLNSDMRDVAKRDPSLKPDAIFVTGDVAFRGDAREYELALVWFEKLAASIDVKKQQIYLVPGNHDVPRCSKASDPIRFRILDALRHGETIDAVLADNIQAPYLRSRIEAYRAFAKHFAPVCGEDTPQWTQRLEARGPRIYLIGFNTALLANDDEDRGKLQLGNFQLAAVFAEQEGSHHEVIIALTHHPCEWLQRSVEVQQWLASRAHIHLCGHTHEEQAWWVRRGAGTDLVQIVAGASYEGEVGRARHGYNFTQLVAHKDGSVWVRVWPRVWSEGVQRFRADQHAVQTGEWVEFPLRVSVPPKFGTREQPGGGPGKTTGAVRDAGAPPVDWMEDIPPERIGELEIGEHTGLYSSFVPTSGRFLRLRVATTKGYLREPAAVTVGARPLEDRETRENWIYIVRDPIRPFEIQIGETRAARPGGDPGMVPLVDGLTLEALQQMYPIIIDERYRWLRMVFAELSTSSQVLEYIYDKDPDRQVRQTASRNPSASEPLKEKGCLFCDAPFLNAREVVVGYGARIIRNDFPYGPFFHYIVMPQAAVHSWETVTQKDLFGMNRLMRDFLKNSDEAFPVPGSAGIRMGFNSSIRHLILASGTRTSAGASIAHVHKQVWGMTPNSVNLSDHLGRVCTTCARQGVDYLGNYLNALEQRGLVFWPEPTDPDSKRVALYVPPSQISFHELQVMIRRPNTGNYLDLSDEEILALSNAEFVVTRLYRLMGINSFNEIMMLRPFHSPTHDFYRLICTFITREVDLAVSELSLLYVVDQHPQATLAQVKEHLPTVLRDFSSSCRARSSDR